MNEREAFVLRMEARLAELDAALARARAAALDTAAEASAALGEEVRELRSRREALSAEFDRLRGASEAAFGDLRGGVDAAAHDLGDAVSRVLDRFRQR